MHKSFNISRRLCTAFLMVVIINISFGEQINIGRVEQMPNLPSPYLMRDWKQVTLGYDSLVFDLTRTGDYLPLIWINNNTVNYPNHNSFGLHTVVGTLSPSNAEAINVLPAVIGASLVGIDKSNQNGFNWVIGCEEWFNKRPEENVYLNGPTAQSGDDWWYDTMPNIFFYQLYSMYPHTGDFDYQFTSVADRWLEAVIAMNGSATPWTQPYMNYRGWHLATMTHNESGVREPEAAGAIAWLLYNAFTKTGEEKYWIGAEWCMEFLSNWTSNPSYELQLPYGVYAAARMNAELGTTYDIEKLLNWCFTPDGNVRNWGVCLGNWGGYDCDGLVGEALLNEGYAFAMNGFEMVGELVPMVRYNDRFARSIGKWVLNVANASRLFYTNFLPDSLQDSEVWAHQYDPDSYIAHESMRENWMGISPYATGDNWGATNLSLYGASHVGIFGGIIDTTNIEGILRLDVLKTDYFHDDAYPTFLYYNPHDEGKNVAIEVGADNYDLYDAVSNEIVKTNASGVDSFFIASDVAMLIVLIPPGSELIYDLDKVMIGNVVIDYLSGRPVTNYPPRIKCLAADTTIVCFGKSTTIYCTAEDRDNNELLYEWHSTGGTFSGESATVTWIASGSEGNYIITCIVNDGNSGKDTAEVSIGVVESINHVPVISKITANPGVINLGGTTELICNAEDPDGDTLNYMWIADYGTLSANDSIANWIAPVVEGYYYIICEINDGHGGEDTDSVGIVVRDSSNTSIGVPIAYYPFNGNANGESGFGNSGTVSGATLVEDRFGNANSAYHFDGVNDYIRVPNNSSINFQEAITISFWMKIEQLFDRESFPISHGGWENRWKVSIIPEKRLRWTVKTGTGIKDLDSQAQLSTDVYYNIVVLYSGSDFEVYINGELDASSSWSGLISTTSLDLTIGRYLPSNSDYNFKGVLDDIRIYDYTLSITEIQNLYRENTGIEDLKTKVIPDQYVLYQNYPNPFNPQTTIQYQLPITGNVTLQIFDLTGRLVQTLVDETKPAGEYIVNWNVRNVSSGIYLYRLQTKEFISVRKCVKLK